MEEMILKRIEYCSKNCAKSPITFDIHTKDFVTEYLRLTHYVLHGKYDESERHDEDDLEKPVEKLSNALKTCENFWDLVMHTIVLNALSHVSNIRCFLLTRR